MRRDSACALCGAVNVLEHRYDLGDYQIARCIRCGILQQAPMPTGDEIKAYYNDPGYAADSYFTSVASSEVECQVYERGLAELTRFFPVPGRLLDVGCGNGQFIVEAGRQGWCCDGIELSHILAEEARRRTGATILEGPVEALDVPDNTYDAIMMWDLVEHLPAPREAMDRAKQALKKPNGVLLISTPDYGCSLLSLLARASYWLTIGWVRAPMRSVFGRAHLIYHSRISIQQLCHQTGFDLQYTIFFSGGAYRYITTNTNKLLRHGIEIIDLISKLLQRQYRMLVVCVPAK